MELSSQIAIKHIADAASEIYHPKNGAFNAEKQQSESSYGSENRDYIRQGFHFISNLKTLIGLSFP